MSPRTVLIAVAFVAVHVLLVVTTLPAAGVLPAALGMLSVAAMALSLMLAARWRLVDWALGGPDKSYVAHRWLGGFALAGALVHWATASGLEGAAPLLADFGEEIGTPAVWGLLILSVTAMIRAIPYHLWKVSHMLMGPVFVLAALHTLLVSSPATLGALAWGYMAVCAAVGTLGWLATLRRKLAPGHRVTVSRIERFDGGIDVTLDGADPLPPFRPGQFATLALDHPRAEAHPFTIAGGDAASRRFVIRAGGDWTAALVRDARVGDVMRLGDPEGRFLPRTDAGRSAQLWVAGGVGITPFLAALEAMEPDTAAPVTLVLSVRSRATAGGLADVERHVRRLPQLSLVLVEGRQPAQMDKMRAAVADMPVDATVFLCGPDSLKAEVRHLWDLAGKTGRIHDERFDFRGAYGLRQLIELVHSARRLIPMKGAAHAPARP